MKHLILSFLILLTGSLMAKEYLLKRENSDFNACTKNDEYLRFKIESTKMGLISTKSSGYVKNYKVKAEYENEVFKNIKITFKSKDLDTDYVARDEKLHELCLDSDKYKKMNVKIPGPVQLGNKEYSGTINVRGKDHKIIVTLNVEKKNEKFYIKGDSTMNFKKLEIPDPSIPIAKLSEEIWVDFVLYFNE